MLKLLIIIIVFLCGLYFCLNYEQAVLKESFESNDDNSQNNSCPNILISLKPPRPSDTALTWRVP